MPASEALAPGSSTTPTSTPTEPTVSTAEPPQEYDDYALPLGDTDALEPLAGPPLPSVEPFTPVDTSTGGNDVFFSDEFGFRNETVNGRICLFQNSTFVYDSCNVTRSNQVRNVTNVFDSDQVFFSQDINGSMNVNYS